MRQVQFEWYRGCYARLKESSLGRAFLYDITDAPAQLEVIMSNQTMTGMDFKIREVASRVRELREISGFTVE